jgi:Tfp pilus assembly protein PilX
LSTERDGKTKGVRGLAGEVGLALAEVLIAGLIIGIVVIGLSLMASWSQVLVAAQGDNRVALFLAEQKLEKMRVWGFDGAQVCGPGCSSSPPCPDGEPCYNETIAAGSVAGATLQGFTRKTCVDYVGNPPYPDTCDPTAPSTGTKRVQVEVKPTMVQADRVTIETVLVNPPTPP